MKSVRCATLEGFEAKEVVVEATITRGLPSFSIVGLVSTAISEAKERVKSALLSNDFTFPPKRITINLSPGELAKTGTHFDLAIALLIVLDAYTIDPKEWFVFGELGLDGSIKSSSTIFPVILSLAKQKKITKAIVPFEALSTLEAIPDVEFFAFSHLLDVVDALKNGSFQPAKTTKGFDFPCITIKQRRYFFHGEFPLDFCDVKGQAAAKRAALIAASGFHNILLEGSPGCGKSMIAHRLRYILPPVSTEEILEIAKLQILSKGRSDLVPLRPFSAPHHSATLASVFGGGTKEARIGEVGLAHLGILFFDELPYFSKNILEALREPMQDRVIRISRVNNKHEYPSDFLFIGAMNPCPCGNLLDAKKECRCSELEVKRYKNRLSEPFLDRIDLYVMMQSDTGTQEATADSATMHRKVCEAFEFARLRGQTNFNARLNDAEIERFCLLDESAQYALEQATDRFGLSLRSVASIKKVARTIADLEQSDSINRTHLLEALSFRKR